MSAKAGFTLRGRNPDVLTCIANLSNDEVFTPPEFANRMLDTLADAWAADNGGANIWADKTLRFLDPCTKTGVFQREIASRLTTGLAVDMPSLEERVNHILTKQVFGIGITYLTSLLARRSVYCSKHAKGEHSIAKGFAGDSGNIWFERVRHEWANAYARVAATVRVWDRSFAQRAEPGERGQGSCVVPARARIRRREHDPDRRGRHSRNRNDGYLYHGTLPRTAPITSGVAIRHVVRWQVSLGRR